MRDGDGLVKADGVGKVPAYFGSEGKRALVEGVGESVRRSMKPGTDFEWMLLDQVVGSFARLKEMEVAEGELRREAEEREVRLLRLKREGSGRLPTGKEIVRARLRARLRREDERWLREGRREEIRFLRELMREYVKLYKDWRKA